VPAAVELHDVVKRYRNATANAVDGVSATIQAGAAIGLLGPNGAGKTTLTKILCGVTRPTSGEVRILGYDPFREPQQAKQALAVVHQSNPMDMMISALDNLKIAAAFRGLSWRQAKPRVMELVEEFELGPSLSKLAFELSGGQGRRLQIVRALMVTPRLLLLDEPSLGLDAMGRRTLWRHLTQLRWEHGITFILTSHQMDEIEQNCDEIIVLKDGRLLRRSRPDELIAEFGENVATITFRDGYDRDWLQREAAATGVALGDTTTNKVEVRGDELRFLIPALLREPAGLAADLRTISMGDISLEEAFVRLAQKG